MDTIEIPQKISWSMDLSHDWESHWSKRSLKKVVNKLSFWESTVAYEVLDSKAISDVFYPVYMQTVMQKGDYRLDPNQVKLTIERISQDSTYQLLWFTSLLDGSALGGDVIHVFPELIKGVYRAFDHTYALGHGMRDLDYYTDYVLQKYTVHLGRTHLNRGLMGHPCTHLGLSMFKLRTGATPRAAQKMPYVTYDQSSIHAILTTKQLFAYYDLADAQQQFRRCTVLVSNNTADVFKDVGDTMQRAGIELVVREIE